MRKELCDSIIYKMSLVGYYESIAEVAVLFDLTIEEAEYIASKL